MLTRLACGFGLAPGGCMRLVVIGLSVLGVTGCATMDPYGDPAFQSWDTSTGPGGKADSVSGPLEPSAYRLPWSCGERYYVSQGNDGDLCQADNGDHVQLQKDAWD